MPRSRPGESARKGGVGTIYGNHEVRVFLPQAGNQGHIPILRGAFGQGTGEDDGLCGRRGVDKHLLKLGKHGGGKLRPGPIELGGLAARGSHGGIGAHGVVHRHGVVWDIQHLQQVQEGIVGIAWEYGKGIHTGVMAGAGNIDALTARDAGNLRHPLHRTGPQRFRKYKRLVDTWVWCQCEYHG